MKFVNIAFMKEKCVLFMSSVATNIVITTIKLEQELASNPPITQFPTSLPDADTEGSHVLKKRNAAKDTNATKQRNAHWKITLTPIAKTRE